MTSAIAAAGVLPFIQVFPDATNLQGANSIAISPDGRHVYVTGDVEHALAVFQRDETTGALTFVEVERDGNGGLDGLAKVNAVTISPDGRYLYAAGWADNAVAVFGLEKP